MTESLLDPRPGAHEQLPLITSADMPAALFSDDEHAARNPEFTAARFFSARPTEYRQIAALRAEGLSAAQCARLFHVSRNTIAAIDRRESSSQTVEQDRNEALGRYRVLERMTSERLLEVVMDPDTRLTPHHGAILLGVLRDKIQLLSGQATTRIERTDTGGAETLAALLVSAREAAGRMGLALDGRGQKGGEPGVVDVPADQVEVGPARAAGGAIERVPSAAASDVSGAIAGDSARLAGGDVGSDASGLPAGGPGPAAGVVYGARADAPAAPAATGGEGVGAAGAPVQS